LGILADSLEKRVNGAFSALEEIGRYLSQESLRFELNSNEREQIVSALAYARSLRREASGDVAQQRLDWLDAESDLDLVLTHLRTLRSIS
jgi:hypothetical protein